MYNLTEDKQKESIQHMRVKVRTKTKTCKFFFQKLIDLFYVLYNIYNYIPIYLVFVFDNVQFDENLNCVLKKIIKRNERIE